MKALQVIFTQLNKSFPPTNSIEKLLSFLTLSPLAFHPFSLLLTRRSIFSLRFSVHFLSIVSLHFYSVRSHSLSFSTFFTLYFLSIFSLYFCSLLFNVSFSLHFYSPLCYSTSSLHFFLTFSLYFMQFHSPLLAPLFHSILSLHPHSFFALLFS